jgi:hypothetical protein
MLLIRYRSPGIGFAAFFSRRRPIREGKGHTTFGSQISEQRQKGLEREIRFTTWGFCSTEGLGGKSV